MAFQISYYLQPSTIHMPIPATVRSKARVCGLSLPGVAGLRLAGSGWPSLVSVVCRQVEVSTSSWSLVQRSPTECGVSECDCGASTKKRARPIRDFRVMGKRKTTYIINYIAYFNCHVINTLFTHINYSVLRIFFFVALRPNAGHDLLIHEVSRSHTMTHHSR
jgi:hypothetical protein